MPENTIVVKFTREDAARLWEIIAAVRMGTYKITDGNDLKLFQSIHDQLRAQAEQKD